MSSLPFIPKPKSLPMPLTNVDQSTYYWHKRNHVEFMLNPQVANLSLSEEGALNRLMNHAARQVPFASLPNDPDMLAAMVRLPTARWNKMSAKVLGAAFVLCTDDRLYCSLMIDELAKPPVDVVDEPKPAKPKKAVSKEVSAARRDAAAKSHAARKAKLQNDDANLQTDHANFAKDELQNCKPVANALQNGGKKGGDLDLDSDLDLNKPTPLLPLPEFKEQVDRAEKTFEQSGIKNIPDHWVTIAKSKYPDISKNQIDLIFAKMQTVYTSQTRFMGTKVRDWSTKWNEFVVRHAPSIIAQSNQFASTQPQTTQQPEPEFVKPKAPFKHGPSPEQLAEQRKQAAEYLASRTGGAA